MRGFLAAFVFAFLAFSLGMPAFGEEGSVLPEWTRDLKLVMSGGQARVNVEVLVNGEPVALVEEEVPPVSEIADLLQPGINELTLRFTPPEEPREAGTRMRVSVALVKLLASRHSQVQESLVETSIPAGFQIEQPCEEVRRFWIGPDPDSDSRLKKRFWLLVEGPPVHHTVAVVINGVTVVDASSGTRAVEVTRHLRKGRNTVIFEGRPTCVEEKSGPDVPLIFAIGPSEPDVKTVKTIENPVASFELDRRRGTEPFSKKIIFRAW